jgi:hypothetical protein
MRTRSTRTLFIIHLLFLAITACQPPAPPTRPPSEETIIALIQTITAQAASISNTEVPTGLPATAASPTPNAVVSETPSIPTDTIQSIVEASATAYIPPTITVTSSPTVPLVSVSSETNCRTGPSVNYRLVGKASVGTKFTVVGKHAPTNYWVIRLADGRECWLWGQYATVEGDVNSLSEYTPPAVGRIEGELRNSSTSDAGKINNAFVNIGLGFSDYKTQSDGKFIFEDVPVGEVVINVRHDYYIVPTFQVYVYPGQLTPVVKVGFVPYNLTLPPPTPTWTCPIFRPHCQIIILPTFIDVP